MSRCDTNSANENRKSPTKSARNASVHNTGGGFSEKKAALRDAFWASALESPSILLWIVTHLSKPEYDTSL